MRSALAISLIVCGCSAIGDPGGQPDGLPHGGTGQFRLLDNPEVGIISSLPGRAMVLTNDAIESAMPAGGHLFYATAPDLATPPMLPADHPVNEIFWAAFEGRRIHRAAARDTGVGAFDAGGPVLVASETWEGGEVFDPWVVIDDDGTARLYYAAAGGIGVAEAPSVEGTFTRVVSDPIVADARRPSVVRGPDDAWWMYFEADDGIEAARSDDGLAFTVMGPLTFVGEDVDDGVEIGMASPGAVRVDTRAGRVLIRLYFESLRDGAVEGRVAHRFHVAASEDSMVFVRHPRAAMEQTDIRFPAPLLLDDRVTLLYGNLPYSGGPFLTRAVVVAVGPSGQRFDPPMEK